ncbi:hypothetical protein DRO24_02350 [Candidatus Bathyarchaeota archaeon]|nr:MAG: hypothetical protein DRO24_02350 [Candidatus Bathyarchaeota archaeon]
MHHHSRHHHHIRLPIRGLLHIAILSILRDREVHGAEIGRLLEDRYNIVVPRAMVYGLLRRMERHGFVFSQWSVEESGPARRIYRITEEGLDYLKDYLRRLRRVKFLIERLISEG